VKRLYIGAGCAIIAAVSRPEARGAAPMMDPLLAWIESTAFSIWMRESTSILAFPAILAVHTVGLALLVGVSTAIDLRVLGAARQIPLPAMQRFMPVLWGGLVLNAASGVALLAAYPTKALTDPVFYVKLCLIAAAVTLVVRIARGAFADSPPAVAPGPRLRVFAAASLACWAGAITTGRLLAYTYTRLTVEF
jgi:hypothetical protein